MALLQMKHRHRHPRSPLYFLSYPNALSHKYNIGPCSMESRPRRRLVIITDHADLSPTCKCSPKSNDQNASGLLIEA